MTDFAHPDLDRLATREAARHSGPLGALLVGNMVLHVTCHLKSVTEPILILNSPTSVVHLPQNMCRNCSAVASATTSDVLHAASAELDLENCFICKHDGKWVGLQAAKLRID